MDDRADAVKRCILIVDDRLDRIRAIREVLDDDNYQIVITSDGKNTLDYLYRRGLYREVSRPDLILLDLHLPESNGWEVLTEIKGSDRFRRIPIVILTSNGEIEDIFKAYKLQSNAYVIKSDELEQLSQIVKKIEQFWLEIVTLPKE